jgi:hypothetical protein
VLLLAQLASDAASQPQHLSQSASAVERYLDVIMQVQCASRPGRLPSVCSLLVPTTALEMELFKLHSN